MKLLLLPAIPAAIAVIAIATDDGKSSAPKHEARHHVRHVDRDRDMDRDDDRRDLDVVPPRPSPVKPEPRPVDPCGPGGCAAA